MRCQTAVIKDRNHCDRLATGLQIPTGLLAAKAYRTSTAR